jgi:hypothetical protein
MDFYVVFDKKGIIHESSDYNAAHEEYCATTDYEGDLHLAKVLARRR